MGHDANNFHASQTWSFNNVSDDNSVTTTPAFLACEQSHCEIFITIYTWYAEEALKTNDCGPAGTRPLKYAAQSALSYNRPLIYQQATRNQKEKLGRRRSTHF